MNNGLYEKYSHEKYEADHRDEGDKSWEEWYERTSLTTTPIIMKPWGSRSARGTRRTWLKNCYRSLERGEAPLLGRGAQPYVSSVKNFSSSCAFK